MRSCRPIGQRPRGVQCREIPRCSSGSMNPVRWSRSTSTANLSALPPGTRCRRLFSCPELLSFVVRPGSGSSAAPIAAWACASTALSPSMVLRTASLPDHGAEGMRIETGAGRCRTSGAGCRDDRSHARSACRWRGPAGTARRRGRPPPEASSTVLVTKGLNRWPDLPERRKRPLLRRSTPRPDYATGAELATAFRDTGAEARVSGLWSSDRSRSQRRVSGQRSGRRRRFDRHGSNRHCGDRRSRAPVPDPWLDIAWRHDRRRCTDNAEGSGNGAEGAHGSRRDRPAALPAGGAPQMPRSASPS